MPFPTDNFYSVIYFMFTVIYLHLCMNSTIMICHLFRQKFIFFMDKGKNSAPLAVRTERMLNYWIIIENGTHDNGCQF